MTSTVDAAAGGKERGGTEAERALEHGASLNGLVDRQSVFGPSPSRSLTVMRVLAAEWPEKRIKREDHRHSA
jgi:hypothetical protein